MAKLRRAMAENGPIITETLNLVLGSEVKVWREGDGWLGPYKVISVNGHDVTVDLGNGAVAFRATLVQQYLRDSKDESDRLIRLPLSPPQEDLNRQDGRSQVDFDQTPRTRARVRLQDHPANLNHHVETGGVHALQTPEMPALPRRRGRPRGSKNKPKAYAEVFISKKERDDLELAVKLRREGKITTNGAPFELSGKTEIDSLIANGTFKILHHANMDLRGIRIFNSRLINKIKGKNEIPYKKSRLDKILTQAPTIQRASQCLLVSLIPTLIEMGMVVEIRDITQAYTQAKTKLERLIIANLPIEMQNKYPPDSLLLVEGPLYGIPEAGAHHLNKLNMETSTYDLCLLISKLGDDEFGLVGMQTDDTLLICTEKFSRGEQAALQEASFKAKPKTRLSETKPLEFNGARITLQNGIINLQQKGQAAKIQPVGMEERAQKYVEQRARGAYLALICQPEAAYDLAVAAQLQEKDRSNSDYEALNKRLIWQAQNPERGLHYMPLNLAKARIMVFTDGSFANNRDLTSQIGFLITMVNKDFSQQGCFVATGNILHWQSAKCKRVTQSVLASEVYGLTAGFDHAFTITSTAKMITSRLDLPAIPVIICTDSFSLYECLGKLGTTKEKRLMINIMALRQSYEKHEIHEIRWIHGDDNPADAFTKSSPNKALRDLVDSNKLIVCVEGFVERTGSD
ncbi:hypothetical protein TSTA_001460 [Talaromyces stipitatus ATCC 10500]|uniref:Reverse transcriptase Ty1/copia-type domain-containing protein n=1 Tax=Talaromyces stipitatus (strain ATCC 10500 / CBS 375.48 / QM 6759 / NRRL 1006) TaxID=441959 RepID=B8MSJ5_TALSN|nr:uncharacterized protein TSTA_001460 [Talaromyces stipitatus ATCC 10500]EED12075.1 hypothetical protein TSTA_001460 [Talaromyces stipitatus ATCC 10500]